MDSGVAEEVDHEVGESVQGEVMFLVLLGRIDERLNPYESLYSIQRAQESAQRRKDLETDQTGNLRRFGRGELATHLANQGRVARPLA